MGHAAYRRKAPDVYFPGKISLHGSGVRRKKLWLPEVGSSELFFRTFPAKIPVNRGMLPANREFHAVAGVVIFCKVLDLRESELGFARYGSANRGRRGVFGPFEDSFPIRIPVRPGKILAIREFLVVHECVFFPMCPGSRINLLRVRKTLRASVATSVGKFRNFQQNLISSACFHARGRRSSRCRISTILVSSESLCYLFSKGVGLVQRQAWKLHVVAEVTLLLEVLSSQTKSLRVGGNFHANTDSQVRNGLVNPRSNLVNPGQTWSTLVEFGQTSSNFGRGARGSILGPGHSLEDCHALKKKVQDLVDHGILRINEGSTPSVIIAWPLEHCKDETVIPSPQSQRPTTLWHSASSFDHATNTLRDDQCSSDKEKAEYHASRCVTLKWKIQELGHSELEVPAMVQVRKPSMHTVPMKKARSTLQHLAFAPMSHQEIRQSEPFQGAPEPGSRIAKDEFSRPRHHHHRRGRSTH
uniref:Uncharacterized protein n=1 Tax=Fagus sylvatica TaxID=28930 RepID=A0A2N9ETQ1_FAGSY